MSFHSFKLTVDHFLTKLLYSMKMMVGDKDRKNSWNLFSCDIKNPPNDIALKIKNIKLRGIKVSFDKYMTNH